MKTRLIVTLLGGLLPFGFVHASDCVTCRNNPAGCFVEDCGPYRCASGPDVCMSWKTVWCDEVRIKQVACTLKVPVWKTVQIPVTRHIPICETRTGTRTVCKTEYIKRKKQITEDHGYWELRRQIKAFSPGGFVSYKSQPKKIWIPKPVLRDVEECVPVPVLIEEPFEYTVTTWKTITEIQTVCRCELVERECVRTIREIVKVPHQVCVLKTPTIDSLCPLPMCGRSGEDISPSMPHFEPSGDPVGIPQHVPLRAPAISDPKRVTW